MKRKKIPLYCAGIMALTVAPLIMAAASCLNTLEVFQPDYPRAGYFRTAEFLIREKYDGQLDKYTEWRNQFSDLSGIMGKVEPEELLRNNPHERICDWFKRYKQDFPEKYVVVHFNGRGRLPTYRPEQFFPGHWLYFEGSDVQGDLSAAEGDVWIDVKDAGRFRLDNGRGKKSPDDISLVQRNRDGSLDWNHAEYVRLLEIGEGRIKVRRAMFGARVLEFKAGQAYAAPIVMGGPWGETRNMVWYYNLSTECPRDSRGRNCADVLVEELGANFSPGGRWETFDGVQFDVMTGEPSTGYHPFRKKQKWGVDCNGDGREDNGIIRGVQTYGLGCFDFVKRLRQAIGPGRIIAADGRRPDSQKSADFSLNGVELEGFPEQDPFGFVTWSGAYNLLNQWKTATCSPQFNYIALRYDAWKAFDRKDLFRFYRLALAATCFTDSFLMANSWTDRDLPPRLGDVFDRQNERPIGWLGKPVGETVHLAGQTHDEFDSRGNPFSPAALKERGANGIWIDAGGRRYGGELTINAEQHLIVAPKAGSDVASFTLKNIPYSHDRIFVEMRLRSAGIPKGYPKGYARWIQAVGNAQPERYKIQYGYCGSEWATYRYYFANTRNLLTGEPIVYNPAGKRNIDIEFSIWGPDAPVEIEYITVHDAPEVMYRKFENGMVIANLSTDSIPFDLSSDSRFGTADSIAVPPKDAVFQQLEK